MRSLLDRKFLGILFAVASYGMYSLHYATMKWLGGSYSLWQLVFIRSVLMLAITLCVSERGTIAAAIASPYKTSTAFRGNISPIPSLLAVGSGFFWALTIVLTRKGGAQRPQQQPSSASSAS